MANASERHNALVIPLGDVYAVSCSCGWAGGRYERPEPAERLARAHEDNSADELATSISADQHAMRVQEAFGAQASTFEDPRLNGALTNGLDALVTAISPGADELCLDVAAGTGHVTRALAPHVRAIVALDAVGAMLEQGVKKATTSGLRNIVFQRGEALELPFPDSIFDLVVTRLSLHHLSEPERAIAEMARVCRPGGRIVLADLVRDPGHPAPDEVERLRDPSHLRVLTCEEIELALRDVGAEVLNTEVEPRERLLEPWLDQAHTPPAAAELVKEKLRAELAGGPATGLRPVVRNETLCFVQLWATVTARCHSRPAKDLTKRFRAPA